MYTQTSGGKREKRSLAYEADVAFVYLCGSMCVCVCVCVCVSMCVRMLFDAVRNPQVAALKNLNLNIVRAKFTDTVSKKNRFYVTDKRTNEKILDPERMEEIRLTILRNMASYHPESVDQLAVGAAIGLAKPSLKYNRSPLGPRAQSRIATKISVQEDPSADGTRSILYLECADRPGLLVDIVKVLIDLSIEVVSAEVDTEGLIVKDAFFITYNDESLNSSMVTLVENALSYYLNLAEIEGEESY